MSRLSFITANPVGRAFDQQEQRDRIRRREDRADQVDAATRQGVMEATQPQPQPQAAPAPAAAAPPAEMTAGPGGLSAPDVGLPRPPAGGNPLAGVTARLAATPGGGARAVQTMQQGERMRVQQDRATMQAEALMYRAMAQGDTAAAQNFARRAGQQLPPELMANREGAALFGRGSLLARGMYRDRTQALRFAQEYVRTNGNVEAATRAAGMPTTGGQGGGLSLIHI